GREADAEFAGRAFEDDGSGGIKFAALQYLAARVDDLDLDASGRCTVGEAAFAGDSVIAVVEAVEQRRMRQHRRRAAGQKQAAKGTNKGLSGEEFHAGIIAQGPGLGNGGACR